MSEATMPDSSYALLHWRWVTLWKVIGATGDPMPDFLDLVKRYSETHRAYHTLTHLLQCFDMYDAVWMYADDFRALEFAIFFHDVVYDTKAKDNEEKSADLADYVCTRANVSAELIAQIVSNIMATKHPCPAVTQDEKLISDIDLSVLGQSEEDFDRYEQSVRQEYSWVPEDLFRKGRAQILRAILAHPQIYHTPYFSHYEEPARANLKRSLSALES